MGLDIKRNKSGKYKMYSSVSDELIHEKKWLTENEAKAVLIERAFWKFLETAIEIDMTFPREYHVNGKRCMDEKPSFHKWMLEHGYNDNGETIIARFKEAQEKIKFDIDISDDK